MLNKIKPVIKFIVSVWKPDFRKTTGSLLITAGVLLLAPNFIQELILSFLELHNIVPQESYKNARVIGALMISSGIIYHLLLIASTNENKKLETFFAISLFLLLPLMIYLSF